MIISQIHWTWNPVPRRNDDIIPLGMIILEESCGLIIKKHIIKNINYYYYLTIIGILVLNQPYLLYIYIYIIHIFVLINKNKTIACILWYREIVFFHGWNWNILVEHWTSTNNKVTWRQASRPAATARHFGTLLPQRRTWKTKQKSTWRSPGAVQGQCCCQSKGYTCMYVYIYIYYLNVYCIYIYMYRYIYIHIHCTAWEIQYGDVPWISYTD